MKKEVKRDDQAPNTNKDSNPSDIKFSTHKTPPLLRAALNDEHREKNGLCVTFVNKDKHPGIKKWQNHAKENQTNQEIEALYNKLGDKNTGYSYYTGIGGLIDIDFDWPWLYYEAERYFGDRLNTRTLKTPNGGFRVLFCTDKPNDFLEYKSKPPYIEIHGKTTHQVVVHGQVQNELGELKKYEVLKDIEIRHDPKILEDFKLFLLNIIESCYFLEYPCIKSHLKGKSIELTQEQRTSIGLFFSAEKIDINLAVDFFRCTDDFNYLKTKDQLERIYKKFNKHPKCKTLRKNFKFAEKDCKNCIRAEDVKSKDYNGKSGKSKNNKIQVPGLDELFALTKNKVRKLRHGQGFDPDLGLTYIGTYPEVSYVHYGISLKKTIKAVSEPHDINMEIAEDIRILGGFTDPLTDKTLRQIRLLLEELHDTGKIEYNDIYNLFEELIGISSWYLDFPTEMDRVIFVFWIIGTYLRALFIWYPYMCFEGLRDVGKSTALEFQSHTCFNGGGDVSGGQTEADLHKAAASTMGFFAIDHLEERLKSDDKRQILNEFLENAWKLNSYVSKRDQNTGERLRLYLACSVALGTRKTTETISEKGLIIRMTETNNNKLRQRSVTMYKDPFFNDIEIKLMAMALNYQDKIKTAYENIPVIPGSGREYNKFLPLLAIAKVVDDETGDTNYFEKLKDYAVEYSKKRKSLEEDTGEILLRLIIREEINNTTYKELSELMGKEGYDKYSWQKAKTDIDNLGIIKRYDKTSSPIKLDIDLPRARERAKARGIKIDSIKNNFQMNWKIAKANPFPEDLIFENLNEPQQEILKELIFGSELVSEVLDEVKSKNNYQIKNLKEELKDLLEKGAIIKVN